jgi:predicted nucleic acid-binding protein
MNILADTSVWVEHFRGSSGRLAGLLEEGLIVIHPVIIGELATGNLRKREETLQFLLTLPRAETADFEECLDFAAHHRLYGCGIGWSDIQLLASAKLSGCLLWTCDRRLHGAAHSLNLSFPL